MNLTYDDVDTKKTSQFYFFLNYKLHLQGELQAGNEVPYAAN